MGHRFRDDYVTLGLEDSADWPTAQIQYRRQVNKWHPDRFAQRPRERLHAEQKFIQLTKAFERVRTFYRINARLPFESSQKDLSTPASANELVASRRTSDGDRARPIERPQFQFREPPRGKGTTTRPRVSEGSPPRRSFSLRQCLLWLVPGAMVVGTGVVFVILDRNAQRSNLEKARQHLIEQTPSEHLPSTSEVQNRARRGAFVEGDQPGTLGDMLMEDVFRQ